MLVVPERTHKLPIGKLRKPMEAQGSVALGSIAIIFLSFGESCMIVNKMQRMLPDSNYLTLWLPQDTTGNYIVCGIYFAYKVKATMKGQQ